MDKKKAGPGRDSRGRFQKGTSPNPKGRPKKKAEPDASPLDVLFMEQVSLKTADGRRKDLSPADASRHAVLQEAFKGKAAAINRVTDWVIRREKWRAERASKAAQRERANTTAMRFSSDRDNADDALLLLGIATRDTEYEASVNTSGYRHLRLEPWIIQAALSRRRSAGPMEKQDIRNIEVCARLPEDIRWPEGARE